MEVAVLGLGRFGLRLAQSLQDQGHDVLGVDVDAVLINAVADDLAHAVIADMTDVDALDALSIGNMDVAVVSTADLEANLLAVMNLQQLRVRRILAKARSERHARILQLMDIERVMRPEHEGADRWAHLIQIDAAVDFLALAPGYGIGTVRLPDTWIGRSLEVAIASAGERRLVALVRGNEVQLNPVLSQTMQRGDQLVYAARAGDLALPLTDNGR